MNIQNLFPLGLIGLIPQKGQLHFLTPDGYKQYE